MTAYCEVEYLKPLLFETYPLPPVSGKIAFERATLIHEMRRRLRRGQITSEMFHAWESIPDTTHLLPAAWVRD